MGCSIISKACIAPPSQFSPVRDCGQCHPEAIAEGSRLGKRQEMRDSSLALRMTFMRFLLLRHSLSRGKKEAVRSAHYSHSD